MRSISSLLKICPRHWALSRNFSRLSVMEVLSRPLEDEERIIEGWVTGLRKMKGNVFIDVTDGSSPRSLQIVVGKDQLPNNLTFGSSLQAQGKLTRNTRNQIEMSASKLVLLGECDLKSGYPFAPRKSYSSDYMRQSIHLRPRTQLFSSFARVRHSASMAVHDFFRSNEFFFIHTPILTSNDCEGAGEVFFVSPETEVENTSNLPREERFFGTKAYLTVSGQFHLEVMSRCLNKVYNFGPTFRAENSKSRLHLAEFYMIEAETAFTSTLEETMDLTERLVKHVVTDVLDKCLEDIKVCRETRDSIWDQNLDESVKHPFIVMSYKEAIDILMKNQGSLKTQCKQGESLNKDHELFLVKHSGGIPIFIVNWPRELKPFYMKASPDLSFVHNFDLIGPNVGEICGGSLREDNYDLLQASLKQHNLEKPLDWYLELRQFGNCPTGGFGVGFERLLMAMTGITNIKDAIIFPRWPHSCKL